MVRLFALALLSTCIFGLSSGTATPKCKQPAVRKEWRELGPEGQKAFTEAIKASICCFGIMPSI
jgi:tyrosinase